LKNLFKKNLLKNIYPLFLGIISAFSLPPYNFFIINFITFPLLFIFILKKENKVNYFASGWFFGFGYFLASLYWISIALTFDDSFKILIPISIVLIPSFLGIFYGIAMYIFSFFVKYKSISKILIFSIILGTLEFIRGSVLTGFPWNLFVYSFSENLIFIQILSIIGTYGLNTICISFFLLPSILILKKTKSDIYGSLFFILIGVFILIYGTYKLKYDDFIKIDSNYVTKVISSKININRFYEPKNEKEIIENLIKLSNPDKNTSTLFIWPEGSLTETNLKDIKKYKDLFSKHFSDKHLIVLGINDVIYEDENENSKVYNSLVVFDGSLNIKNLYYKNNLVPFGEFLPLEKYLKKLGFRSITHGYQSFSKGKERKVIKLNNQNIEINFLPLICYEIIYSGKITKYQKYDFIVNISEDGWFGNSIGPYQHFSHSIFRSIEEGKNIIRSSNNGISAYINRKGQIIKKIESTQSGFVEISSYTRSESTIFSTQGNKMFFYLLLIYITFIFFINKKGEI